MSTQTSIKVASARGPAEHSVRDQIVEAAHEYFAHYGYAKTTVADLAREIGFSKAYIYRFFESKQAIGEAIVADCLDEILTKVRDAVESGRDANDKLRKFAKTVTSASIDVAFNDRKIYEVATHASSENWAPVQAYVERLREVSEPGVNNIYEVLLMGAIAVLQIVLFALAAAGVQPLALFNKTEFLLLTIINLAQTAVAFQINAATLMRTISSN